MFRKNYRYVEESETRSSVYYKPSKLTLDYTIKTKFGFGRYFIDVPTAVRLGNVGTVQDFYVKMKHLPREEFVELLEGYILNGDYTQGDGYMEVRLGALMCAPSISPKYLVRLVNYINEMFCFGFTSKHLIQYKEFTRVKISFVGATNKLREYTNVNLINTLLKGR